MHCERVRNSCRRTRQRERERERERVREREILRERERERQRERDSKCVAHSHTHTPKQPFIHTPRSPYPMDIPCVVQGPSRPPLLLHHDLLAAGPCSGTPPDKLGPPFSPPRPILSHPMVSPLFSPTVTYLYPPYPLACPVISRAT